MFKEHQNIIFNSYADLEKKVILSLEIFFEFIEYFDDVKQNYNSMWHYYKLSKKGRRFEKQMSNTQIERKICTLKVQLFSIKF